jgi:hypothetical protein
VQQLLPEVQEQEQEQQARQPEERLKRKWKVIYARLQYIPSHFLCLVQIYDLVIRDDPLLKYFSLSHHIWTVMHYYYACFFIVFFFFSFCNPL